MTHNNTDINSTYFNDKFSSLLTFILTISRKISTLKCIIIGDYPRFRKLSIFRWDIYVGLGVDEKPEITSALIKFRFNALIYFLSLFSKTQFQRRPFFRSHHRNFLDGCKILLTHHKNKLREFF